MESKLSIRNLGNKYSLKHGKSKTRLYRIWLDIKQRCYNSKQKVYQWYGAKGIHMCEDWKNDYTTFEKWANENGYDNNLTIDRINTEGNYEPKNCRWVDFKTQSRNKVNTIIITHNGKSQCLQDWCVELKKPYSTIAGRIRKGWQPKIALLVPKNIRRNSYEYKKIVAYIN